MWLLILVIILLFLLFYKRKNKKEEIDYDKLKKQILPDSEPDEFQFRTRAWNAQAIYVRPKDLTKDMMFDSDFIQIKPENLRKGHSFVKADDFLGTEITALSCAVFGLNMTLKEKNHLSPKGTLFIELPESTINQLSHD